MKCSNPFAICWAALLLALGGCQSVVENVAIASDGMQIHFGVSGKGNPTLVFVHGWCGDRTNWDHIIDDYTKQYQVVTIDLPGFGDSGRNRETWDMSTYGEDVMAVVNRLNLDQVILIGYSMGDKVIVEAAKLMPERVLALVGIDNFRDIDSLPVKQIEQVVASYRASFEDENVFRNFLRQALHPSRDSTFAAAFIDTFLSQVGTCASTPEIALSVLEAYKRHDLKPALKEITVPIRAINSDLLPTDIAILQQYNQVFRVVNYSGAGHLIIWEDPDELNRHLSEVLAELTGG